MDVLPSTQWGHSEVNCSALRRQNEQSLLSIKSLLSLQSYFLLCFYILLLAKCCYEINSILCRKISGRFCIRLKRNTQNMEIFRSFRDVLFLLRFNGEWWTWQPVRENSFKRKWHRIIVSPEMMAVCSAAVILSHFDGIAI